MSLEEMNTCCLSLCCKEDCPRANIEQEIQTLSPEELLVSEIDESEQETQTLSPEIDESDEDSDEDSEDFSDIETSETEIDIDSNSDD